MLKATLTSIPSEIPKKLVELGEYEPNETLFKEGYDWTSFDSVHLDNAWAMLGDIFRKTESALKFAIEGEYSQPNNFADWDPKRRDFYLGYVLESNTKEISKILKNLSNVERIELFDNVGKDFDDWKKPFEKLVDIYNIASLRDHSIMIMIF